MRLLRATVEYACLTMLNLGVVGSGMAVFAIGPFSVPDRSFIIDQSAYQAFYEARERAAEVHQGVPVRLQIPELDIDIAISSGSYNASTHQWTLDDQHAFYASITPPANSAAGNTLIYGHNIAEVFSVLHDLKPGMNLIIDTDTGAIFEYEYASQVDVLPTEVHRLRPSIDAPIVTLQTCSGNWNEYRRLFEFNLTRIQAT